MKAIFKRIWLLLLTACLAFVPAEKGFEEAQKNFERVAYAYERKEELFFMRCRSHDVSEAFGNMYIRVFKQEGILELWVQNVYGKYVKFNEYKVYAMSGTLGPKRQLGDAQVPEGFYSINEFNPFSKYHLSLGINYPNQSDRMLSNAANRGGSIYIHGGNASAGCVAMSDYYIEDIYMAAVKAKNQGQAEIPVHIFPFKMTPINMHYYSRFAEFAKNERLWKNLQQGFQFFERTGRVPDVYVASDGYYKFTDPINSQASGK